MINDISWIIIKMLHGTYEDYTTKTKLDSGVLVLIPLNVQCLLHPNFSTDSIGSSKNCINSNDRN